MIWIPYKMNEYMENIWRESIRTINSTHTINSQSVVLSNVSDQVGFSSEKWKSPAGQFTIALETLVVIDQTVTFKPLTENTVPH